jgi:hypothetical protein
MLGILAGRRATANRSTSHATMKPARGTARGQQPLRRICRANESRNWPYTYLRALRASRAPASVSAGRAATCWFAPHHMQRAVCGMRLRMPDLPARCPATSSAAEAGGPARGGGGEAAAGTGEGRRRRGAAARGAHSASSKCRPRFSASTHRPASAPARCPTICVSTPSATCNMQHAAGSLIRDMLHATFDMWHATLAGTTQHAICIYAARAYK